MRRWRGWVERCGTDSLRRIAAVRVARSARKADGRGCANRACLSLRAGLGARTAPRLSSSPRALATARLASAANRAAGRSRHALDRQRPRCTSRPAAAVAAARGQSVGAQAQSRHVGCAQPARGEEEPSASVGPASGRRPPASIAPPGARLGLRKTNAVGSNAPTEAERRPPTPANQGLRLRAGALAMRSTGARTPASRSAASTSASAIHSAMRSTSRSGRPQMSFSTT